jgi:hypothetical protein
VLSWMGSGKLLLLVTIKGSRCSKTNGKVEAGTGSEKKPGRDQAEVGEEESLQR